MAGFPGGVILDAIKTIQRNNDLRKANKERRKALANRLKSPTKALQFKAPTPEETQAFAYNWNRYLLHRRRRRTIGLLLIIMLNIALILSLLKHL